MQIRKPLHLYLIALIIAATLTSFSLFSLPSRALAQIAPAATDVTNTQILLPAQQDTTIVQLQPTQNFGALPSLAVGRQIGIGQINSQETLLQWDLSAFPFGTTITDAAIGLFQTEFSGNAGPVLVYRVFTTWDENKVTWATRPEVGIYDRTWSPATNTSQYIFYQGEAPSTARSLVDSWVNAPVTNRGLLLSYGGTGDATRLFASLDAADNNPPLLRIDYTLPRIRVCLDIVDPCQAAGGAQVYDKTIGQVLTAGADGLIALGDLDLVALGDELWARLPVNDPHPQSRLFYTTAALAPVTAGQFQTFTDSDSPEMRLVVRSDKPLLLYDLNLTAQWYLNDDPAFLATLQNNIIRASDYLYDFTEGQFALGTVTVRQMYDGWDDADIKLHTSNVLHPNATIGGIVLTDTVDVAPAIGITYVSGSIFMGSYWNRFGAPPNQEVKYKGVVVAQDEMADDWSIALAHEMSHYLLFLFDTYTDQNGVSNEAIAAQCVGSAMGNAYAAANQAFVFDQAAWDSACGATEAHFHLNGRTEWNTIAGWYNFAVVPNLVAPGAYPPVALTNVVIVSPAAIPPPLAGQLYSLAYQQNQTSSGEARAFLLRDDSLVFEQGKPAKGTTSVELTDAREGDRLCVYDLNDHAETPEAPRYQFGCETVARDDSQLIMTQDTTWNPTITVAQMGAQQLSVTVQQALANGLVLQARLIPETDAAGPVQSLVRNGDIWTTVFNLPAPVEPVYLQLWVQESPAAPQTRREVIADRGTGGNGAFGPARHYGGVLAVSSDGNASYISNEPIELKPGESIAWQSMPGTPPVPPWKRISGQSYRLDAFPPSLVSGGAVSIEYLDAFGVLQAAGAESQSAEGARIHFWDGSRWLPLLTTVGTPTSAEDGVKVASAPSQGVGIYAVMVENQPNLFMPVVRR